MTYEVTSEPSAGNATTAESAGGLIAGQLMSSKNVVIGRAIILAILAVLNVAGNGFTLITIRLTPRLWTKTNFILASMLVADCITAVLMFWYTPFLLVVYVYNDPCHYNVVITATTPLFRLTGMVSFYHLILISIERYIAIVYPLKYETKFSDRALKLALSAVWVAGIIMGMSWAVWLINADAVWLINADRRKCDLIPEQYHLIDVVGGYVPVCICMFFVYGRILIIWQSQRTRLVRVDPAPAGTSVSVSVSRAPSDSSKTDKMQNAKGKPPTGDGRPASDSAALTNLGDNSSDVAEEQQRQQIRRRRREFKAVYLTAAIVGAFVVLWFPGIFGRVLLAAGYHDRVAVNYLVLVGGAIGLANFTFSWAIYAAASKSYRRAYRQMLIRIGCCCCKNITIHADHSLVV